MFLSLDESKENTKKVLGGILLPKLILPKLEFNFTKQRIEHKVFGELKWERISKVYYQKYKNFLKLFFTNKDITFHSICYRSEKEKYKYAYILIRTITWKLQNSGINNSLFILFDNDGPLGEGGTRKIKEIAGKDKKFKTNIDFCNQGTSHILGALQISDIITGAISAVINQIQLPPYKQNIVDYIEQKNSGIPLSYSHPRLPGLKEIKIHFFDPRSNPGNSQQ